MGAGQGFKYILDWAASYYASQQSLTYKKMYI